mgnify:CR=1 FL=1
MRHNIDLLGKLGSTFETCWHVCAHLAYYVQTSPDQVTAACCVFLAAARLLTWVKRR